MPRRSLVNRAVLDGLAAAAPVVAARAVEVRTDLAAREPFDPADPALYEALVALFRALPRRVARGSILEVMTLDRSGGDIELAWEARIEPLASEEATPREVLRAGEGGDLLELALDGLEGICRTRAATRIVSPGRAGPRRRFTLLIPSLARRQAP